MSVQANTAKVLYHNIVLALIHCISRQYRNIVHINCTFYFNVYAKSVYRIEVATKWVGLHQYDLKMGRAMHVFY